MTVGWFRKMLKSSDDPGGSERWPNRQTRKKSKKGVDRRGFLKSAAVGAAGGATALVAGVGGAGAPASAKAAAGPAIGPPTAQQIDRDAGNVRPPAQVRAVQRAGSDLMVQVLKDLGIEYVASNPGSSFEGIQESIVNYGDPPNTMPEFITALHEETSVDMANGYGKAEGRPMCAMLHGTIGIQHAAMAIYQAYYAGTPMLLLAGRDDGFIQAHTANDMAGIVRHITKWGRPTHHFDGIAGSHSGSLPAGDHSPDRANPWWFSTWSFRRKKPATWPCRPTARLKSRASIRRLRERSPRHSSAPAIRESPSEASERLTVSKARVELAELAGASVSTGSTAGPMSFPQRHPLCGPGADTEYDYTLGLESNGTVSLRGPAIATLAPDRDVAGIGYGGLRTNAPAGGRGGRGGGGPQSGQTISVDAEASIPAIVAALMREMTADNRRTIEQRKSRHAAANAEAYVSALRAALEDKKIGWDASPVSTARIYAELWPLIMDEDWCLSSPSGFSGGHHRQLWAHNKPYSYLGGQGAGGMGYGAGASGGAALAAKHRGRIVVNVQTDGDMNYTPGVLWSAAHHRLPLLSVMHNNRAWHQELMFPRVHGRRPRAGNRSRPHRHDLARPVYRLRQDGRGLRHGRRGPDRGPGPIAGGAQARRQLGQTRRTVHDRRGHPTAVNRGVSA